ncbi:MAG TPA: MBL fold metallo-hydrolase [Nocardioidaceae bacterium]|nr:MBL fold metallo-hydrolase [Nocardioidaceae bacterium]
MTPTGSSHQDLSLTFVGNATVLLRLGPFTVLTDPNFLHAGQRAYLGYGLWSKRLRDPALAIQDLPALDAIVLSHLHGDHWDRVAERGLSKHAPVVTTPAAARTLAKRGFETESLRTWQTTEIVDADHRLTITAMPGKHAPSPLQRLLPEVMGSIVDLETGGQRRIRLYISGDTLCVPELAEVARRYPDIDAAMVHLGGTKLLKLVLVTMDGEQGAELVKMVRPRVAIPIHTDDYTVFTSPVSEFEEQLARSRATATVQHVERGERLDLGRLSGRSSDAHP